MRRLGTGWECLNHRCLGLAQVLVSIEHLRVLNNCEHSPVRCCDTLQGHLGTSISREALSALNIYARVSWPEQRRKEGLGRLLVDCGLSFASLLPFELLVSWREAQVEGFGR